MSELPTLQDELNRKAFDTVDWFVRKHAAGEISDEKMATAAATLWMAVAGLTSPEVKEIVSETAKAAGTSKSPMVRVFVSDQKEQHAVIWLPGSTTLTYARNGSVRTLNKPTAIEAREAFDALCRAAGSYQELTK